MNYTTKTGTTKKTYVLSGSRQNEMTARGWRIHLAESYQETAQELYDRLAARYSDVRIYESTTQIAGLHSIFAMCK